MNEVPMSPKRRPLFIFLALVVLSLLLVFGCWLKWGQYSLSTTDAYVEGNIVEVSPKITGTIRTVAVNDTDHVQQGQVLATLDATDYLIQFNKSQAKLASTLRSVQQMFDDVQEIYASIELQQIQCAQSELNYQHRLALVEIGAVAREEFEKSYTSLLAGQAEILQLEEALKRAQTQTFNTTVLTHPLVQEAIDAVKMAWVQLSHTKIRAPIEGFVAKKTAQVGESADPSQPFLAIIPLNELWVNANFKENKLARIRLGQPVEIKTDMYKKQAIFSGRIEGISPGTGSVFSLLPPQNATGNWVKIAQRIPVRIRLDPQEVQQYPLRLGLSATATVDVRDLSGGVLTKQEPPQPLYQTEIFDDQLKGVEKVIEKIVQDNLVGCDGNEIRN